MRLLRVPVRRIAFPDKHFENQLTEIYNPFPTKTLFILSLIFSASLNAAEPRKPNILFIHLGFSHPHDIRDGMPELLSKYGATNHEDPSTAPPANPKQPPLPPNWLPAHPFDNTIGNVRETQLFNLSENPHELLAEHKNPKATNLAKDPQHAAKLTEMRTLLLAEMRRLNDPWRFSDQPDDGLTPPEKNKPGRKKKDGGKAKQ